MLIIRTHKSELEVKREKMDPETVYETMMEILRNEKYRLEAEPLFIEEINSCNELSKNEKDRLIDLVVTYESEDINNDKVDPRIKEIVGILVKSESFKEYCMERSKINEA